MSTPIARLGKGFNTRVVPVPSDYDTLSAAWSEEEHRVDLGDSGSIAGYWEGQPGWVSFDSWPYTEICVIIEGRVAVEHSDGTRDEFAAGDAFVIPAGHTGIWHTLEPTRKYFVGVV